MSGARLVDEVEALDNPFWTVVRTYPGGFSLFGRWEPEGHGIDELDKPMSERRPSRGDLAAQYSWAIPSPGSLAFVAEHVRGRGVVEVGAGTGYWGWLLGQLGIPFNGYDVSPPREGDNHWHCPRSRQLHVYTEQERAEMGERRQALRSMTEEMRRLTAGTEMVPFPPMPPLEALPVSGWVWRADGTPGVEWVPIRMGGPEVLALPENQGRVLLLCWPPYDKPMGVDTVRAFRGDTVVFIGEDEGGCTGDDALFEELGEHWDEVDEYGPHVAWSGIHDRLTVFERKGPRA